MSTATAPHVTPADVRAAIDRVPDPEMPPVSVGQLGMVVGVRVHPGGSGGRDVEVDLVATYSGCPALQVIDEHVADAVAALEGVRRCRVRWRRDVTWTPQRITPQGRDALREFGIAPPGDVPPLQPIRSQPPAWWLADDDPPAVPCPLCGSEDTERDSPFGPTPCRSTHYCRACRNPFEAIKP